jgi:predicted DNA-binding transcriptional regulator YafY
MGEIFMGTKETILRQWLTLKMIPRKRRISTTQILDRLRNEKGVEVELRSVQRDLNSLGTIFPLVNDEKKPAGWSWSEDAPSFDIPSMDPMTALSFKLAERHVGKLFPHGVHAGLKPYFLAAEKQLKQTSSSSLSAWPDKVRVISRNLSHIPPVVSEEITETVYIALLEDRRFAVQYRNTDGGVKDFEANPLGMVFVEGLTYLVVTLFDYQNPVLLLLHRMLEARLLDTPATAPEGFDLDRYIARELSFPVGKDIKLKVRFFRKSDVHRLQESPIAEDQRIKELGSDNFELTATVMNSVQLRWWLRGYGERVEIIKPKSLRDEFVALAQQLSERYRSA